VCAALLTAAALLEVCEAAGFQLVADGKARATIVTGQAAGEFTRLAVSELEKYIEQLSGAQPGQVTDSGLAAVSSSDAVILIGTAEQNPVVREAAQASGADLAGLKKDGFVLKTTSWKGHPALLIAGADDAGTLYGAYEFLGRLGITFRLTGDIVPPRKSELSAPNLDVRMEPAFPRRGFLYAANADHASIYSWPDYERLLDQMARMKCNYLQFWWFPYAPWIDYSYKGERKLMGDVTAKESGYHGWVYGGFGSRTIDDVSIGRQWFKDRPRLAPLELQHVQTPEEAYKISESLLRRVIAHAAKRNIKVWLAVELAALPPNLARPGEIVGESPFNYLVGTFLHPLDPVNREIQVSRLKALAQTYPQAEGIFLNFAELYPELANEKHRDFFERERPRFHELRDLSIPWSGALANFYDVKVDRLVDSTIGYFDLFKYLLKERDEVAPGTKIGLMTVGRAYALPLFNKLLPPDIPFTSLESSGVWTRMGMPMSYFAGMGKRERTIQPRIDDDFDMLGMQFSVRQYYATDRILVDGVKDGLSGFAGQLERARGTEFNSSYLAEAAWNPGFTPEAFYREAAEKMFGDAACEEMYQALMKLEENQHYLGYYEYDGGYGVLLCCSPVREIYAVYQYWRQKDPYDGPTARSWQRLISAASDFIAQREGSIALLNQALDHMRAASAKVAPQGQYELAYLENRTEVFRDSLAALNTYRRGMVNFDSAFRHRDDLGHEAFVAQLESSMATLGAGHEQLQNAAREYSQIIDHVSDLPVLYHINARLLLGTELSNQFLQNVVNYQTGKPYLPRVNFERLIPRRPDQGAEN